MFEFPINEKEAITIVQFLISQKNEARVIEEFKQPYGYGIVDFRSLWEKSYGWEHGDGLERLRYYLMEEGHEDIKYFLAGVLEQTCNFLAISMLISMLGNTDGYAPDQAKNALRHTDAKKSGSSFKEGFE